MLGEYAESRDVYVWFIPSKGIVAFWSVWCGKHVIMNHLNIHLLQI
jgi:hypothetical protein